MSTVFVLDKPKSIVLFHDSTADTLEHKRIFSAHMMIIREMLKNKMIVTNSLDHMTLLDIVVGILLKDRLATEDLAIIKNNTLRDYPEIKDYSLEQYLEFLDKELLVRQITHDNSKLDSFEKSFLDKKIAEKYNCQYTSDNYNKNLSDLGEGLAHHYAHNRHHPNHFDNGVYDMNIVDFIDMLIDWIVSAMQKGEKLQLEYNQKKYNYEENYTKVFQNTVQEIENYKTLKKRYS